MEKRKVDLPAKLLSNHDYLNEVSVEGKKSSRFNFQHCNYDHYAAQSSGQETASHFLTTKFTITEDSFWNINYFEDLTKYVFWTFNKSFLLKITANMKL
jgi:hypothetical protein